MLNCFTIYRALLLKDDRETKTLMHRIRITGTVLVTPFLIGGAAFGVWDVADKIKNWQSMTPGGTLAEAYAVLQMVTEVAAIALALIFTGSLWRRCLPRHRTWRNGAATLPNLFSTSGKYAVWRFQRPPGRRDLFGTLTVRKKMRKQSRSYLLGRQPRDSQQFIPASKAGRDSDDRQVQNAGLKEERWP